MKILSYRRGANSQLNVVVAVFSNHTSKFSTMISRCIYYSESGVKDYFCFRFVVILFLHTNKRSWPSGFMEDNRYTDKGADGKEEVRLWQICNEI